MIPRVEILKHWIKGNRNDVSLFELLDRLFTLPCVIKAKLKIIKVVNDGEYLKVYLDNIDIPLYFPTDVDIFWLYQTLAESLYPRDWHYYLTEETNIEEDDIVVDCGSAEGVFALTTFNKCKRVYAIEPMTKYVRSLQKTFQDCKNVEILPVALSNEKGNAFIQDHGAASSLSNDNIGEQIELTTIDNLFFNKNIPVNYIKADLEGYEMKMLNGARKTIEKYLPKISITTYHKPEHAKEIYDYLKGINNNYLIKTKGIEVNNGVPVMLHAWCKKP